MPEPGDDEDLVHAVAAGLLGGPLPNRWDDARSARGTGRGPLTDEDRAEPGSSGAGFPLFG